MLEFLNLIINITLKHTDIMYSFINKPQERIYTITRLE